ncbi:MAG TPA: oxidoreductase [Galbitalea sp.]|nr:oxidoreductase [Galbitalea sp.]
MTMYRLVLYCLILMFIETELLSIVGVISESPLAILVSGVVLVAFSLSNSLFAMLFRVKPHTESAIITGLLLLFVMEPVNPTSTNSWLSYVGLASAALIAQLSKFVIAFRGRHIFNPAALGAFVVTLIAPFGVFAAWWLGTAWLLPVTVVLGFAILYRTRRLLVGIVFVVSAFVFISITYYDSYPLPALLAVPFTTFATVFFAAFMLSEPLTLPPRRWQQLVEVVVVAALFSFPLFTVGSFSSTPQFALLVGNLLAFIVSQRRGIRLDFIGRSQLTPTSWELSFRPQRPVRFRPGQYMELTIPHSGADSRGLRRIFSIASAPHETDVIRFGLNTAERSSSLKKALLRLEPGEIVSATSVGGDFLLPGEPSHPLLFVAGGIGITPFMSHLEHLTAASASRDVQVIYSASSPDELAYASRLAELGIPVHVVSSSAPTTLPEGWTYLGTSPLTRDRLLEAVPDVATRATFVSGPPSFVSSLRGILRSAHAKSIRTDYFTGYTRSAKARYKGAPIPKEPAQVG